MSKVKSRREDPRTRAFVLDPMRRVLRAVHRDLEAVLARIGYPEVRVPHINVFAHVPRGEGMRMSVLAEQMQLTPGAVTQLVAHLERLGLVRRVRDPSDGRGVIVAPTEAAERGYNEARGRLAKLEEEWERIVGPRRWKTFKAVLWEVVGQLEVHSNEQRRRGRMLR
jgi:DNA-binding MarR family transcriptional regulator